MRGQLNGRVSKPQTVAKEPSRVVKTLCATDAARAMLNPSGVATRSLGLLFVMYCVPDSIAVAGSARLRKYVVGLARQALLVCFGSDVLLISLCGVSTGKIDRESVKIISVFSFQYWLGAS